MVGVTTVTGGTLQINNSLALEGQTLDVNVSDTSVLSIASSALALGGLMGTRSLALPAIPLTIGGNGASTSYSGNLSGALSLTKSGSGTLYLGGSNSYASTTVAAGTLEPAAAAALPNYATAGAVTVAAGANLVLPTGNGVIGWSGSQLSTVLASVSWSSGAGLGLDTSSGNQTYSGTISPPLVLTKLGNNTLTLSGTNTYSGGTNVNGGGLVASSDAALGSGPLSVAATATVNFLSANPAIGGLAGAGSVVLGNTATSTPSNLTVNNTLPTVYSGTISEAQGPSTLVKSGPSTLTLSGTNSYTGGTTVQQGTLVAANVNALGTGGVLLQNGAALSLVPANQVSGFGSQQLNGSATLANNVLTLTTGGTQAGSAFTQVPLPITNTAGFTASFVYTASGSTPGDGATFTIQADGATALGGTGSGLGYQGISTGGAVALNLYYLYNSTGPSTVPGTAFCTQASPPGTVSYLVTTPVNLTSGDPILVALSYSGTASTLTETLTDETTQQSFSTTYTGVNFPSLLGSSGSASGFVGFTGSTGDGNSVQTISNFQFTDPALANIPYANPITVAAAGELNLSSPISASAAVSSVTLNAGAVLSITRSGAVNPNAAYQITAGSMALAGNSATVNVTNNGSGLGSFAWGPLERHRHAGQDRRGGPGAHRRQSLQRPDRGGRRHAGGGRRGQRRLRFGDGQRAGDPQRRPAGQRSGRGRHDRRQRGLRQRGQRHRPRRHRRGQHPDHRRQPDDQQPLDARLRPQRGIGQPAGSGGRPGLLRHGQDQPGLRRERQAGALYAGHLPQRQFREPGRLQRPGGLRAAAQRHEPAVDRGPGGDDGHADLDFDLQWELDRGRQLEQRLVAQRRGEPGDHRGGHGRALDDRPRRPADGGPVDLGQHEQRQHGLHAGGRFGRHADDEQQRRHGRYGGDHRHQRHARDIRAGSAGGEPGGGGLRGHDARYHRRHRPVGRRRGAVAWRGRYVDPWRQRQLYRRHDGFRWHADRPDVRRLARRDELDRRGRRDVGFRSHGHCCPTAQRRGRFRSQHNGRSRTVSAGPVGGGVVRRRRGTVEPSEIGRKAGKRTGSCQPSIRPMLKLRLD